MMTLTLSSPSTAWVRVCKLDDILPGAGVCALVDGAQVAVFRVTYRGSDRIFAVGNHDPYTSANVLSRGLTGSYTAVDGLRFKVASPLLKHAFDLETGVSLDDPALRLPVYAARAKGGDVWIGLAV
ncbi:nitrite reductase small subunit NirD [Deinococcus oregonensis]|uniref:Nitrite reductase small subunit NirD n=1 Tax=Deinococcus oregonensis TaxID=1805970 RepID=A0ABV6B677_9DEIO